MYLKLSLILQGITILKTLHIAQADLKFCYRGRQQINKHSPNVSCPYGLLFREPVIIGAIEKINASDSQFCLKENICSSDTWKCAKSLQYSYAQLIVTSQPETENHETVSSDKFIDRSIDGCLPQDDFIANAEELQDVSLSRKKRQVVLPPSEDKRKYSESKIQSAIDDQTKRLFYYLSGINAEEVNSHLRVTQLFLKSIRLVHMICDSKYLKEEFLDSIEKAFMFLLKEQGFERVTDVDVDDYAMLRRALELCMADPSGYVEFIGNHCPANFYVDGVKRNGVEIKYDRTDTANFVWGKDIAIDGAWHIIDIVHGMCFATLRENLNLHHKFQVVMEQLFHDAIQIRWNSATKLKRVEELDNIFMSPINTTMEVLDACSQGAYIGSPFLHRLNRPQAPSRKKRSAQGVQSPEMKNSFGLEKESYCLQSEAERTSRINDLKQTQCITNK